MGDRSAVSNIVEINFILLLLYELQIGKNPNIQMSKIIVAFEPKSIFWNLLIEDYTDTNTQTRSFPAYFRWCNSPVSRDYESLVLSVEKIIMQICHDDN